MSATVRIALSKGRILEEGLPLLKHAGVVPSEDPFTSRKLILDTNLPQVKLIVIRATDVPTYVQFGAADLGVAGKDVLMEYGGDGLYEQDTATAPAEAAADDWGAALAEQAAQPAQMPVFDGAGAPTGPAANNLDMILDIPVNMTVELGRTKIAIRNLLQLAQGSVVELDGLAGEPMSVLVNGTLVAQGEVVVVNDKFGIRLTDIITPSERIRKLQR